MTRLGDPKRRMNEFPKVTGRNVGVGEPSPGLFVLGSVGMSVGDIPNNVAANVKLLLFCGVGCQVQAVEHHLNLEKLYVLGTNCGSYLQLRSLIQLLWSNCWHAFNFKLLPKFAGNFGFT
ncbi:hypothetical protein F8388_003723 [Cannabis sativa]|uniref:Uncharacterized protein n=1 Tax=Cannabis sativa TaxID=3483 RepID=A0A7J6F751_CANSA|nr:hypothetical protein F8388_003723 [Cannabis sativa]KAF4400926.1 hypothetical protein G4B88_013767 [Cannabis sativa]